MVRCTVEWRKGRREEGRKGWREGEREKWMDELSGVSYDTLGRASFVS